MKTPIALIAACILAATTLNAQNTKWARSFGGPSYDQGQSIAMDASGNIYTTGNFMGTVDFDPGAGTAYLTSAGNYEVFVQKLDASGNFIWAKSFGGTSKDVGYGISVDADGNVYTTGTFHQTADFDPGPGTANLTSAGNLDIFVQKMDASGNFIWAKTFGAASNDLGTSITVDAAGNVYSTGYFNNTVDFDPGPGTANLTSAGNHDIFILKLDASGNFMWAKSFGSTSPDAGNAISADASGNVYTTGFFDGSVDFDPGPGTVVYTSAGNEDIFVLKLDGDGNFVWAKSFGDWSSDVGNSITVDASGNVYSTGYFSGSVNFNPGGATPHLVSAGYEDVFVQKMDASGNYIWAKSFGGIETDEGKSIAIDASGNVYTTGSYQETVDFDPGAGVIDFTAAGGYDIFTQKMDASGNFIWAKSYGDTETDEGKAIKVDGSGNIYAAGYFNGSVDFYPRSGTALEKIAPWLAPSNTLISEGGSDIFVQKIVRATPATYVIPRNYISPFRKTLAIYPNPTLGHFSIDLGVVHKTIKVSITDNIGRMISTESFYQTRLIDLSIEKPAGAYIVQVDSEEGTRYMQLIKK